MKGLGWLLVLGGLGILTAGCAEPMSSRPAPEITGTDSQGKALKLSDYRGKVVLLDFWRSD